MRSKLTVFLVLKVCAHILTRLNLHTKLNPMAKNVIARLHKYFFKVNFVDLEKKAYKRAKKLKFCWYDQKGS